MNPPDAMNRLWRFIAASLGVVPQWLFAGTCAEGVICGARLGNRKVPAKHISMV
jgi:hypothetical protein